VHRGELVAIGQAEDGSEGIVVHSQGFLGSGSSGNEFGFMSTEVSRERPVNYEDLARRLEEERTQGGYLLWVTNNHNSSGRFYETFGNHVAKTVERDITTTA